MIALSAMYDIALHKRNAPHTRRFTIRHQQNYGWEVLDKSDSTVLKRAIYRDWHRVERALAAFVREEAELRAEGWEEEVTS